MWVFECVEKLMLSNYSNKTFFFQSDPPTIKPKKLHSNFPRNFPASNFFSAMNKLRFSSTSFHSNFFAYSSELMTSFEKTLVRPSGVVIVLVGKMWERERHSMTPTLLRSFAYKTTMQTVHVKNSSNGLQQQRVKNPGDGWAEAHFPFDFYVHMTSLKID